MLFPLLQALHQFQDRDEIFHSFRLDRLALQKLHHFLDYPLYYCTYAIAEPIFRSVHSQTKRG
jgi:hypothetical protein